MYARGTAATGTIQRRKVCLLSLDGGGVRGISSLMILKNLMEFIDPRNPPNPCDCFDMIGGTSTGGLIALMLGRLRMSVDECIEAYERMSPDVFTKLHHRVSLKGESRGRFDHKALENHVKQLLESRTMSADELLDDELTQGSCKTFVCAMSQRTGRPTVFSSYNNRRRGMDLLKVTKIWEAARATSAATTFFEPITIGGETFLDGATGANNPIRKMLDEARDIFGTDRTLNDEDIECVVSIGTGVPSLKPFGPGFVDIGEGLLAIATDTEEVADSFRKDHSRLFSSRKAFRFNVHPGLEGIGLEDVAKWGDIQAATRLYIQKEEVQEQIEYCVRCLSHREWVTHFRGGLVRLVSPAITTFNDDEYPTLEELPWLTHTRAYRAWTKGESAMLWYQQRIQSSDDARKAVAATVAYRLARPYRSFIGQELGVGPCLRRALYYQCDRRYAGDDFDPDASDYTSPEDILWSLICQCLLIDHETVESFYRRLMELPGDLRTALQNAFAGHTEIPISSLFNMLTQVMQACTNPVSIALDNVHLLQGPNRAAFWDLLRSFNSLIRSGHSDGKMGIIISGCDSRLHDDSLNGFSIVNDETEQNECLSSLHFPEWNARRSQVADAQDGTNDWLWSHSQYKDWEREDTAILWIEGKPGSGKSVLAKSIQSRLGSKARQHEETIDNVTSPASGRSFAIVRSKVPAGKLVADWFYSTRLDEVGMAHLSLLRSILYQLMQQTDGMFDAIATVYRQKPVGNAEVDWSIGDCMQVLRSMSTSGTDVICIIDAMDEAASTMIESTYDETATQKWATILKTLWGLASHSENSKMKFIVLSRPDDQIELDFNKNRKSSVKGFKIVLEQENQKDIELIIRSGLSSLRTAVTALDSDSEDDSADPRCGRKYRGLSLAPLSLPRSQERTIGEIGDYLRENAAGVILWVNLVIGELIDLVQSGGVSLPALQAHAKMLPLSLVGADSLYEHIAKKILHQSHGQGVSRARSVFMLIHGSAMLGRPIFISEIWEALAVPTTPNAPTTYRSDPIQSNRVGVRSWTSYRRHLRRICGAFVEIIHDRSHTIVSENQDAELDDIGPDDIVQFTHRTVKDFLQIKARALELYFSDDEAIEHVKIIAQRYLELSFPEDEVRYGPRVELWESRSLLPNLDEYLAYLQEKILLQFSLIVVRKFVTDFPGLEYLLGCGTFILSHHDYTNILLGTVSPYDMIDLYPAVRPAENKEYFEGIAVGESFRIACSKGLLVALQNLFAICSLLNCDKGYRVYPSTLSYVAKNGALATAITYNLTSQVRHLTKAQRHQAGLVESTRTARGTWPLERGDAALDPFVRLAVLSGSIETVEFLFDKTESFYARNAAVREFAVTSRNLGDTTFFNNAARGVYDDDSVSSISDDHLYRIGILNPDTSWRRRRKLRVTKRHRESRREIKYSQLRHLCIELAGEYPSRHPTDFKARLEDVQLAVSLVTNIGLDMEASWSPYRADTSVEPVDPEEDLDNNLMQADAYKRFLDRHIMKATPRESAAVDSSHSMSGIAGDWQRSPRLSRDDPAEDSSLDIWGTSSLSDQSMDRDYRPTSHNESIANQDSRVNERRTKSRTAEHVSRRTNDHFAARHGAQTVRPIYGSMYSQYDDLDDDEWERQGESSSSERCVVLEQGRTPPRDMRLLEPSHTRDHRSQAEDDQTVASSYRHRIAYRDRDVAVCNEPGPASHTTRRPRHTQGRQRQSPCREGAEKRPGRSREYTGSSREHGHRASPRPRQSSVARSSSRERPRRLRRVAKNIAKGLLGL